MPEQLLSTDPKAGLLSTDPNAVDKAAAPSAGTWEDRGVGGKVWHPADGVTEGNREDNSLFGMPPEFAVLSGLSLGRAIGAAGLTAAGRAVAGLKNAAAQVTPVLKYEVAKHAFEAAGVPSPIATVGAMVVSGYKKGPKAAAAEAEAAAAAKGAAAPAARPAAPAASPMAAEPIASPAPASSAAPAVEPPAAPANAYPDQKALNEAALAKRRAAYQASQAAPAPFKPGVTPIKLTAAEVAQGLKWAKAGVPEAEILQRIEESRAFASKMDLRTPTVAETKFPKGMRGGAWSQSVTPNEPPVATAVAAREATVLPSGTQSRLRALGVSESRIGDLTIDEANKLLKLPKSVIGTSDTITDARLDELLRRNFGGRQR